MHWLQICAQHFHGVIGGFDRLCGDCRHAAEIVDLFGDSDGVRQFFPGVRFQPGQPDGV
jgi:hypothetical protein